MMPTPSRSKEKQPTARPGLARPGLVSAVIAAGCLLGRSAQAGQLQVHFLNVGQGNSALVIGPDGTRVLIDGGDAGDGNGTVRPYLASLGVTSLQYSIATHWHADHIGGMDEVFNAGLKPTIAAYDRGDTSIPSTVQVSQYLAAVASPPGLRQTPVIGSILALGDGATLQFMSANGQYIGGSVNPAGDENAHSISVVIRYGDFDCWIGGDLTGGGSSTPDVETGAVAAVGQVEVAQADHHGSNTSSNATLVSVLNPSFVVQSAGLDNPYGHPTKDVTNRWNTPSQSRVQWCTTEGDTSNGAGGFFAAVGHIQVSTDGNTFQVTRSSGSGTLHFTTFEQAGHLALPGQLLVSEVMVDPTAASDAFGEWFELFNRATYTLDLAGLKIASGASQFTLASALLIAPGERLVIGVDGRMSRNGQVFTALGAPWESFALSNTSSSLSLTSAGNATIEAVAWGAGGFAVQSGKSAERIDLFSAPAAGNFASATTAWAAADLGTPGTVNASELPSCSIPVSYCVGAPNSVGAGGRMGYAGTSNVNANDLVLVATGLPSSTTGFFFYGIGQQQALLGNGFQCILQNHVRLPAVMASGGVAMRAINYSALPPSGPIQAGDLRNFQFWYRNPAGGGAGFNLSDGLSITFCAY